MATREEILRTLNTLQIGNFKSIIDFSKEQIIQRQIEFERLQSFITTRKNRINSLVNAIDAKFEEDSVLDEYVTFQNTAKSIGGQSDNLDEIMGAIHYTVYGDVKRTKLRKRELTELNYHISSIDKYIDEIETLSSDLDTLTSDLDAVSS